MYNFFGLSVAKELSSVHRTLIDAMRTVIVWCVSISIHYGISINYGEAFNEYSMVQLAGFCFLILGTLCYNQVLHIPCIDYHQQAVVVSQSQLETKTNGNNSSNTINNNNAV